MVIFGAILAVALAPVAVLYAIVFVERGFGIDFRFRTIWDAAPVLFVTVLIGLALGWLALRLLLGPTTRLIARTGEIERGAADAFRPIGHYGTREMALLGERFGRLARRLKERNEDLVLFSRHLTHELKSPVTAIRGAVELMRDEPDMAPADRDRFLRNIEKDAERLDRLASGLRDLASAELRASEGTAPVSLALAAASAQVEGIEVRTIGEPELPMSPANAEIVMLQLVANAREAGAELLVARADGEALVIGDDGAPVPQGDRDRLLEPFYTTKRSAGGTGLGLSIASAVLARHGVELDLADEPALGDLRWKFRIAPRVDREPPR